MVTSHHDSAADLARELAALVLTSASARMPDSLSLAFADAPLHVALRARAQVLTLLRAVAADVVRTPEAPNASYPTVADKAAAAAAMPSTLADHGVVTDLVTALRAHPEPPLRFPERDPAPLLASPGAARWEKVAHHALLAGAAYPRTPGARTADQQWAAVADVAALARALTVLDGELSHAVHRLTHSTLHVGAGRALEAAAAAPHLAAAAAAANSAAGVRAQAPYAEQGVDLQPRSVIAVTSPRDLVRAQGRLPRLITTSEHLGPAAIAAVLTGQARLAAAATTVLAETDPRRARTARNAATALTHAAATAKDSASLHPDAPGGSPDPRPDRLPGDLPLHVAHRPGRRDHRDARGGRGDPHRGARRRRAHPADGQRRALA